MHIENELVEFAITGEEEYEEVVEEYEEEISLQEGVPELTDAADTAPAQGKPQCITLIFLITIYIHLRVLLVQVRVVLCLGYR
jgi:hypothetical protein